MIEPAVVFRVLDRLAELPNLGAQGPDRLALSEREAEMLQLMAKSSASKRVVGDLSITESMVNTHVANIFQKLDVSHHTEAVTKAMSQDMIKL